MFALELSNSAFILGVAREKEVKMIRDQKILIKRKDSPVQPLKQKMIKDSEFYLAKKPDIIFLTIKNPIDQAVKYYFQNLQDKPPTLLISQNGISAISDAKRALKEVLGESANKVRLIRIILFNPIEAKKNNDIFQINYSLPIKIALAKVSGPGDIDDVLEIFEKAGFRTEKFPSQESKNLEYSKLFLNLIGMASASRNLSIKEGFKNREIFQEELSALKEYIKAVALAGARFVNFSVYPVKTLAGLLDKAPPLLLIWCRNFLAKIVTKDRGQKPKDLDEIDYYNGAVIRLGQEINIKTPINEKIRNRVLIR
jgi:2-dehydropantoate 2-reductase